MICTTCKIDKEESEFYFNEHQGCPFSKCKVCLKLIRDDFWSLPKRDRDIIKAKKYIIKEYGIEPTPKSIEKMIKWFEVRDFFHI